MNIKRYTFPCVEKANPIGLLAISEDLNPNLILSAYEQGVFPWPQNEMASIPWFSPDPRGVLFVNKLHISKSLKKFLNKNPFTITLNKDFDSVINECAHSKNRIDSHGTWITKSIIHNYSILHKMNHAFSIEVWNKKHLVGGLYGIHLGSYICGESMFYNETNASKVALLHLINLCKNEKIDWIDTQMVTNILNDFGALDIPRSEFMKLLSIAINKPTPSFFTSNNDLN